MVGRLHRLAIDDSADNIGELAVEVEFEEERSQLLAEPEAVGNRLDRFDVEIRAGQVALLAAFEHDRERRLAVGVGQEDRFHAVDRALVPVELDVVQHERSVGRVQLVAETVVRQRPERAVAHVLDAGETLDGLAVEGQRQAGRAHAVLARHGAERGSALAVGRRELAGAFQMLRCVGRCGNDRVGGQHGLAFERGRKLLLVGMSNAGKQSAERGRGQQGFSHGLRLLWVWTSSPIEAAHDVGLKHT